MLQRCSVGGVPRLKRTKTKLETAVIYSILQHSKTCFCKHKRGTTTCSQRIGPQYLCKNNLALVKVVLQRGSARDGCDCRLARTFSVLHVRSEWGVFPCGRPPLPKISCSLHASVKSQRQLEQGDRKGTLRSDGVEADLACSKALTCWWFRGTQHHGNQIGIPRSSSTFHPDQHPFHVSMNLKFVRSSAALPSRLVHI